MAFKIYRVRITKDNINQFTKEDKRVGSERFNKEKDWLKNEILDFIKGVGKKNKEYPERYDLTVMSFHHYKKPYFLLDGSHRIEAIRELLEDGKIEGFDVILLPDNMISRKNTWEQLSKQNKLLDKMLKEEGLPLWVKKHDFLQTKDGHWIGWVNERAINSGGKDMKMLSFPEYMKTREPQ